MGKRKHRDPAERDRRAARREARAQARIDAIRDRVHPEATIRTFLLDAGVNPEDIIKLEAEGFVGKRVHVTGTPENWPTINPVTPPDENEDHDDSTATAD